MSVINRKKTLIRMDKNKTCEKDSDSYEFYPYSQAAI